MLLSFKITEADALLEFYPAVEGSAPLQCTTYIICKRKERLVIIGFDCCVKQFYSYLIRLQHFPMF